MSSHCLPLGSTRWLARSSFEDSRTYGATLPYSRFVVDASSLPSFDLYPLHQIVTPHPLSVESVAEELPNWSNASLLRHEDSRWYGRNQWYKTNLSNTLRSSMYIIPIDWFLTNFSHARCATDERNPSENPSSLGINQQRQHEVGLWSVHGQLLRGLFSFIFIMMIEVSFVANRLHSK